MKSRALGRILIAGATIASLSACGGGGSTPSGPTASPSTSTQQVRTVLGTSNFEIRAGGATFKSIDNPPVGMMDATAEWGNASNPIDFFVTDGRCPGFVDLQAGRCTVLARAEGTAKPKRLTFSVTTATGVYLFWIYNRGNTVESGAIEVAITTNGPVSPAPGLVTPSPSPGSDPRAGLPPGPVTQARVAIRSIDTGGFNYRDPQQDSAGNWIVHPGEFVVFDLSQRNGAGEKCQWIEDPEWLIEDEDSILGVRGSSQPFLLRVDVNKKGYFEVTAEIDGVRANLLSVTSIPHGN
jgi:hypothetical protein